MAERSYPVVVVAEQLRRAVPGGIGSYARGLLAGLVRCSSGVELTLLASRSPRRRSGAAGATEMDPLARYGRPVLTSKLPGPLLTRAWDHGVVRAPTGFDVVHSVSLAGPSLPRRSTSTLVVTCHDLAWRRFPHATTRRGRRWHEGALRRARESGAAFVVPSRLVAADLEADGVEPGRITVIRGGSDHLAQPDEEATTAVLERAGVVGDFLLSVGTLEPRKNVERMVRAYGAARAALDTPWPLVVVGPQGWGPSSDRPPLRDSVSFTGAVPDGVLSGLYRRCRAFVYVPLTEGYGFPPLEAMRHGTPVVVSRNVPSVHDLGDEGAPPALLVDALDVDDMARGMGQVLTDDALRSDLAARGPAFVSGRTWDAAARQHVELWGALP